MRIVLDPGELDRFAGFLVDSADDHGSRGARLRAMAMELPAMPPEVASSVRAGVERVARDLEGLSGSLYAEALVLRARAAALDPALRRFLTQRFFAPPG